MVTQKSSPVPGFAAHADLAAHEFGQALDDGEPEAGAAVVAGGGGIDLREGLEQAVDAIGGDADAGVGDFDAQLAGPNAGAGGVQDHVALVGELDGVAHADS
jgi:hypothetical protein